MKTKRTVVNTIAFLTFSTMLMAAQMPNISDCFRMQRRCTGDLGIKIGLLLGSFAGFFENANQLLQRITLLTW
jgi:hypothetical protein